MRCLFFYCAAGASFAEGIAADALKTVEIALNK